MLQNDKIQLFEDKRIRTAWDEEREEWYFSVVDVVAVLTDQPDYQAARNYWKVTKKRLKDEGNETVTACNQLKMIASDGKKRLTDVADTEQLLRIIQSIGYSTSAIIADKDYNHETNQFSPICSVLDKVAQ